jgi:hypothetical protein
MNVHSINMYRILLCLFKQTHENWQNVCDMANHDVSGGSRAGLIGLYSLPTLSVAPQKLEGFGGLNPVITLKLDFSCAF